MVQNAFDDVASTIHQTLVPGTQDHGDPGDAAALNGEARQIFLAT